MPKTSIYFREETEKEIRARAEVAGGIGTAVENMLSRYRWLMKANRPEITRERALALVDINNGTIFSDNVCTGHWNHILAHQVEDAAPMQCHGADQPELVAWLHSLTPEQGCSLVDSIEMFWASHETSSEVEDYFNVPAHTISVVAGDAHSEEAIHIEACSNHACMYIGMDMPHLAVEIDGEMKDVYQFEKTVDGLMGVGPLFEDSPEIFDGTGELLKEWKWMEPLLDAADEHCTRGA